MDIVNENESKIEKEDEAKLILEQAAELKTSIYNARTVLSNANNVVVSIEKYQKDLEATQEKINKILEASNVDSAEIVSLKKTSEDASNESTKQLDIIKKNLTTVNEKIIEMEATYKKFEATNLKIIDPNNGLDITLEQSQTKLAEILDLKNQSLQLLDKIQKTLAATTENTEKMVTGYTKFELIEAKVFDKETGLEATFDKSQTIKTEIEELKQSSQEIKDSVDALKEKSLITNGQISDIKNKAQINLSKIEEHESNCVKLKEQMTETLNEASDKALASSFSDRKALLTTSVKIWKNIVIFSLLILCVALIYFFGKYSPIEIENSSPVLLFLYRISLTSPLLYLVFFSISQYSREKNILERYAFKAATGLSLNNYVLILNNHFNTEKNQNQKENEAKIIDFVISSMQGIYEEPYPPFKEQKGLEKVYHTIKNVGEEVVNKIENTKNTIIDSQETEQKI
jgi:hypothetical protein